MRATDRPMTLIDIALMHQAVQLDPVLASISDFIDEHDEIVERVRKDLVRDLKNPDTGQPRADGAAGVALDAADAHQELGPSRTPRTDRGWLFAASVQLFLLR